MMSRRPCYCFSFPFCPLMTKGEWKPFMYSFGLLFCFELPWSFVRTMWCENLCNVCYSVLSCRTWVYSKDFLLVCDIFELWTICFLFFCVLVQKGPDTPGYSPDSPEILTGVSRLIPGVSGSNWQTHFIEWITCHMHHTYSWHSLVHPTVNLIRAFVFLSINMPIIDMSSQNWNSKFMAYI